MYMYIYIFLFKLQDRFTAKVGPSDVRMRNVFLFIYFFSLTARGVNLKFISPTGSGRMGKNRKTVTSGL